MRPLWPLGAARRDQRDSGAGHRRTTVMLTPRKLQRGDKVRFISPASMPDRDAVLRRAATLERWGFAVEYGEHAVAKEGPFAGSDEQRAADLNAALRDPSVRAIFATRGGRGCYRIADRLEIAADDSEATRTLTTGG